MPKTNAKAAAGKLASDNLKSAQALCSWQTIKCQPESSTHVYSHPCVAQLLAFLMLMHEFRIGLAAHSAL